MFEPMMDDYLTEEGEWTREVLEQMCAEWDEKVCVQVLAVTSFLSLLADLVSSLFSPRLLRHWPYQILLSSRRQILVRSRKMCWQALRKLCSSL
jgi:hypothetical protein